MVTGIVEATVDNEYVSIVNEIFKQEKGIRIFLESITNWYENIKLFLHSKEQLAIAFQEAYSVSTGKLETESIAGSIIKAGKYASLVKRYADAERNILVSIFISQLNLY
jgi:hypothetical protein